MITEPNNMTIEDSFNAYETIQMDHLSVMRSQAMPDLVQMTMEREAAFQVLRTHLESIMTQAELSADHSGEISELSDHKNRLSSIMKLDAELSDEIKKYKETLKASIHRLKKGKTAINGYRIGGSNRSPAPRVLSMNR